MVMIPLLRVHASAIRKRQTDCVHILWDGMETDVADQLGIHDATSRM